MPDYVQQAFVNRPFSNLLYKVNKINLSIRKFSFILTKVY